MAWASIGLAALGPIALIPIWLQIEVFVDQIAPGLALGSLTGLDRLVGYLISLVPAAIAAWGFLAMSRLFQAIAGGRRLDAQNARRLRRFAMAVLLVVPTKVVAGALLSVWLTRGAEPGHRQLIISFSSDELALLAIGMLLLVLASVLGEAAEIADEHRQFV